MGILRKRPFWYFVGIVAAGGAVAAYAIPPRPPFLNWVLDALAFFVTFVGGLMIISQFVLPVQTMRERRAVFDHLVNYASGMAGAIIFVKDGGLVGRREELRRSGYGVALVDPVSAIVVERTSAPRAWFAGVSDLDRLSQGMGVLHHTPTDLPLVRAAGPGISFIAPGERIVATLDLRRQSRSTTAQALTRDGIEVSASVSVTFGLDPDPERLTSLSATSRTTLVGHEAAHGVERVERNQPAYPFNPASAFRAVYGVALTDKQPGEWSDLPLMVAVERWRDLLAEHTLDELFQPTERDTFPLADFVGKLSAAVKAAPVLRERGILVYSASARGFKMPREVINQRVRSWQARWHKATIQHEAAGQSQAIRTENRWRAQAQQTIVKDFQALLGASSDPLEKKALAMMMAKALQRAAAEPSTRKLLSSDALRTLDTMQDWLK